MKYRTKTVTSNFQLNQICHHLHAINLIQLTLWALLLATFTNMNIAKVLAQPPIYNIQASSDRPLVNKLVRKLKAKKVNKNLIKVLQQYHEKNYNSDDRFIISPHTVNNRELNPFTTTIILNGSVIDHLTDWRVSPGYEFGSDFSDNFVFNGLVKLNGKIEESLN